MDKEPRRDNSSEMDADKENNERWWNMVDELEVAIFKEESRRFTEELYPDKAFYVNSPEVEELHRIVRKRVREEAPTMADFLRGTGSNDSE